MGTERSGLRTGRDSLLNERSAGQEQRLDRWLFFARISKSRTLAQKLCQAGHVRVNRNKAQSGAKTVRPGDVLTVSLPSRVTVLKIVAIGDRRGPASEARTLYEDVLAASPPSDSDLEPPAK
ncbi:RNA-binding S4 domain-containing protein [Notoacmeibacter sp. MSK16QG-6]|uniref:RNA-binding S4 domain-containing protein n=1 Tax=Notoacmeibacter sp. MSK16QG-6 TaxID=2957982 RepID=UPI00209F4F6E|nr:RNA-binding S4 domain-containing protein [Notoacmeibacter sp. MSK16QG-6]MCP1200188.1 RNA-binding S4 domain-containing protein [Notoacmeibacter sp. MSK16QG-6]